MNGEEDPHHNTGLCLTITGRAKKLYFLNKLSECSNGSSRWKGQRPIIIGVMDIGKWKLSGIPATHCSCFPYEIRLVIIQEAARVKKGVVSQQAGVAGHGDAAHGWSWELRKKTANGKPTCGDPNLLKGIIRGHWKLNGYISSDCDSLDVMLNSHHSEKTAEDAVADALNAELDCRDSLRLHTLNAIKAGLVNKWVVDRVVSNNIEMLMRLGFFDGNPTKQMYGTLGIPCQYMTPVQGLSALVQTIYEPRCNNVECYIFQIDATKKVAATAANALISEVTSASKGPVILVIMSGGGMDIQAAKKN
ncbi:beta-xylosidase/alpha-L-arabinofuranosidase 2-like protein [Tanacetum coccineum]|uniref:Beta-xylosidase/alpha-L-arabinofuranosidase 2-like protein n=1 Tax=Tanacetum coccineum TaxID=301880 RepID=A0ABQ5A7E4_9ASTR